VIIVISVKDMNKIVENITVWNRRGVLPYARSLKLPKDIHRNQQGIDTTIMLNQTTICHEHIHRNKIQNQNRSGGKAPPLQLTIINYS